jgi:hypothetical protein
MNFACSLMLTCFTAVWAFAADSEGILRERLILCSQFVIEDSGSTMIHDTTGYCCRIADWGHDCRVRDWDVVYSR